MLILEQNSPELNPPAPLCNIIVKDKVMMMIIIMVGYRFYTMAVVL